MYLEGNSSRQQVYSKDDKTVANEFNISFASVGKSINSKIESLEEGHTFDLHESTFTPRCFPSRKQLTDNTNAMPSN